MIWLTAGLIILFVSLSAGLIIWLAAELDADISRGA